MRRPLQFGALLWLAAAPAGLATPGTVPLDGALALPSQVVPTGESVQVALPALPARPGKVLVLRFQAFCRNQTEAGCNYNATLMINDSPIGRFTTAGEERLLGREPSFELRKSSAGSFPALSSTALMLMFAPDAVSANAMATDGQGATFCLEIGDLARGVDGNVLTLRNNLKRPLASGGGEVVVERLEVGWLARAALPAPKSEVPPRGAIADAVAAGGMRLCQAKGGGFAIQCEGVEVRVETTLEMRPELPSILVADDAPSGDAPRREIERWGPAGYRMTATWPGLTLVRTLELRDGLTWWRERWTNTGQETRGVPFRHRVFLQDEAARFWIGGSPENAGLASGAQNPTLFLESRARPGQGLGIVAESDWLRLLMSLRARAGVGEIYSEVLALAPGSSIDFTLTLSPARDQGGYWSFINALRRRWGCNGVTMERPVFWGYARASGEGTPEARAARALGHLGPITVVLGPWQRLEPDARVVAAGKYPRLPEGAPRAPGACPDFDVEAFLSRAHREPYWEQFGKEVAQIRRACPNVRIMQMIHPSMEAVYKPLQHRWPIASDAIQGAGGATFEDAGYSRSWVRAMTEKEWGVLYYVPRPGSAYLEEILEGMRRALDQYGADGIYCDEFSWAFTRRGYSRYDHSRWDGYSADLDAEGKVVRLKCDNAYVTEATQLRMAQEVLGRGKFFLGNGAAALRSVNSLPIARFIEGGNGYGAMAFGHLSPTPLVLGNMGDQTTRKGVFESVRACLSQGCIYSPTAVNLLLEGPDNFVCKLYPITVREIGPGWVMGEERLATAVSGAHRWPGRVAKLRLYRYNADGELQRPVPVVEAGPEFRAEVPERGLLIAEVAGP